MFGLPTETSLIMGGVLGLWVLYTAVFYVRSRGWSVEDSDRPDEE